VNVGVWVQFPSFYFIIMKECKFCGKSLLGLDHYNRRSYCNKDCWRNNLRKVMPSSRKCARDGCNNIIPVGRDKRQKFCSHSCSALKSNPLRRRYKFCLNCGNILTKTQMKFCCSNCGILFRVKYKIDNGYLISQETARNYYIILRGYKCEECKLTKWKNQPIFLSLHHIDGNYQNNKPENVKLLCGNCHPFTDTFGTKNMGKGRKSLKLKTKFINNDR
jgi:hypothetical protein